MTTAYAYSDNSGYPALVADAYSAGQGYYPSSTEAYAQQNFVGYDQNQYAAQPQQGSYSQYVAQEQAVNSLSQQLESVQIYNAQQAQYTAQQQPQDDGRYVRTYRDARQIGGLSEIDHIYQISDMHVGNTNHEERNEWLLDINNKTLGTYNVILNQAIERLMLEILSNAGDNGDSSRRFGVNPGDISVTMNEKTITVRSGGEPIPVMKGTHLPDPAYHDWWLPRYIFGVLRTSTNYDSKVIRMGCGRNGYGAKLVNIFSNRFSVKVADHKNRRLYHGVWNNHMKDYVYEHVEENYDGESYVEIEWDLDFARFSLEKYGLEYFALFARLTADFGFTCKMPTKFNGISLDVRSPRHYASLFWSPEICKTAIMHYQWGISDTCLPQSLIGKSTLQIEAEINRGLDASIVPSIELCLLDTPDEGRVFSFVNGLITRDGGIHVTAARKAATESLLEVINNSLTKGKKKTDAGGNIPKLTLRDVEPHISMILNCRLPDPKYKGQTKDEVSSIDPKQKLKIVIPEEVLKGIGKWKLVERLYAALDAKVYKEMKKTDGRRERLYGCKGQEANKAGTAESENCIHYLVEGNSAAGYIKKRIALSPGGKDYAGHTPCRGKFLNVHNFDLLHIAGNKEVIEIKGMLGLTDYGDYTDYGMARRNFKSGFVVFAADSDVDGFHIVCLWVNYFHTFHKSLIQIGKIGYLRLAVVKVFADDEKTHILYRFFTEREFDIWITNQTEFSATQLKKRVKYYKGLASSTDLDLVDDMSAATVVILTLDDEGDQALNVAFNPKLADTRKKWLAAWREITQVDDVCIMPVSSMENTVYRQQRIVNYCNRELIEYALAALDRAIPSYRDIFKTSQRKVTDTSLDKWNYGNSKVGPLKADRLANISAERTHYHHGMVSLVGTICVMAQNFIGSNNLPFFTSDGQFGTRDQNGRDCGAARYVGTKPGLWVHTTFDKKLTELVGKVMIEGEEGEHKWVPQWLPLNVINGFLGVAVAHSTFLPPFHPMHIAMFIRNLCLGIEDLTPLCPWWKGFKGSVTIQSPSTKKNSDAMPSGFEFNQASAAPNPYGDWVQPVQPEEVQVGEEVNLEKDENDLTQEQIDKATKKSKTGTNVKCVGLYQITKMHADGTYDVLITELPPGKATADYRLWLEEKEKNKEIKYFEDKSNDFTGEIKIIIEKMKGRATPTAGHYLPPDAKSLGLVKTMGLNNITLLDDKGYPFQVKDVKELIRDYYFKSMIELIGKLIAKEIEEIEMDIYVLQMKAYFIGLVCKKEILIIDVDEAITHSQMDHYKVPRDYIDKVKPSDFSLQGKKRCEDKVVALQVKLSEVKQKTPQKIWCDKLEKEIIPTLQKLGF